MPAPADWSKDSERMKRDVETVFGRERVNVGPWRMKEEALANSCDEHLQSLASE